jgi:hypothetical protein
MKFPTNRLPVPGFFSWSTKPSCVSTGSSVAVTQTRVPKRGPHGTTTSGKRVPGGLVDTRSRPQQPRSPPSEAPNATTETDSGRPPVWLDRCGHPPGSVVRLPWASMQLGPRDGRPPRRDRSGLSFVTRQDVCPPSATPPLWELTAPGGGSRTAPAHGYRNTRRVGGIPFISIVI